MSRQRRRAAGEAGFTLVELLIAAVVFSLVALLMLNGMRFARRATATADQRREAVESTVTGLGLLRATLGRAVPVYRRVNATDVLIFDGRPDGVRFVTAEPDYIPGWPLVGYAYTLVPDAGGRTVLEVRRAALNPAAPDLSLIDQAPARRILGFGGAAAFTFYGTLMVKDAPLWRRDWQAADMMPQAVRIGPDGASDPSWPDFVVPLAINTPAICMAGDSVVAGGGGGNGGGTGAGGGGGATGAGGARPPKACAS